MPLLKIAVFLAVLVTAFLSGWSTMGLGGGLFMAAALGGGGTGTCGRTLPRRLTR